MMILRQKVFFQSRTTGEYFTGKELQDSAAKIQADYRNGAQKFVDVDGKTKPYVKKISKSDALREAYVDKNTKIGRRPTKEFNELVAPQRNAYRQMEKNGLIKNLEFRPNGSIAYSYKKAPSKFMRKLSKLSKKFKV